MFARGFGEGVGEPFAEIQPGVMAAFAVIGEGFAREQCLFDGDGLDGNGRGASGVMQGNAVRPLRHVIRLRWTSQRIQRQRGDRKVLA